MGSSLNESIDLSGVGQIAYKWDFDREDYEDYLAEEQLQDNQETLMEYINDCISFEIDLKDNETLHSMGCVQLAPKIVKYTQKC